MTATKATVRATPFLTFQPTRGPGAADAMAFYTGLFDDGEVLTDRRHGSAGPAIEGTVEFAEFVVAGQRIRCSDSYVEHAWTFNPAVSFWVECPSAEEQQRLAAALGADGTEHMPLDDYGFGPFAWVEDRFGLSWQLALGTP